MLCKQKDRPSGNKISVNKILSVVGRSQKLVVFSRLFFRDFQYHMLYLYYCALTAFK